jgi:ring-1,2-phenylacetyl-CoA epoxidase subunit PaaC
MLDEDSVYDVLSDVHGGDDRWAYGTGFDDPLAGVDTVLAPGIDAADLAQRCLALGEDEVALANIALDLLGQARLLLTRAAHADPALRPSAAPAHVPDEDALAYFRGAGEFRNVRLVELDDEHDFAVAIARLFAFVTWRLAALARLDEPDSVLAAIAAKAVTELTYHRDYAAAWLIRLGDGTDESHRRMQAALDRVWPYLDELFLAEDVRAEFDEITATVLESATVQPPDVPSADGPGGRTGRHTEALAPLLADLQSFARANPDASW